MRCRYTVLCNTEVNTEDTNNKSATTPLKFQGGLLLINKAHYCFEPGYGVPSSIAL